MGIPLFDLTQQYQTLAPDLSAKVTEVLCSGAYINGPFVREFEALFAQFLDQSPALEVISCNSGTDALYLALRSLKIGPGDEVITSVFSFFASAEAISLTGAKPIFVDIDPKTYNFDLTQIHTRITPRTRAIIPVHLFGQPVNMTALMALADRYQLAVVEDCAQAVGACWQGQRVGTYGTLGCYSFYPTKNLGALGDGGAVVTTDPQLARRIRQLKNHGQNQQYLHDEIGVNSRLDALQAALLSVKLPYLQEWTWRRRSLATRYQACLQGVPALSLPVEVPGGLSVWNQFTVQILELPSQQEGSQRDRVQQYLQKQGVSSRIYYPIPLHLQPAYANLGYQTGDFPQAEICARQVLSLPFFPELTLAQQDQVIASLRQALIDS